MPTFRDLDLRMIPHPITGDLVMKNDVAAVIQSVRELVMASAGEFIGESNMGAGVYKMLFELADPTTIISLQKRIEATLQDYEPRIEIVDIQIQRTNDLHAIIINISFYVLNQPDPVSLAIPVKRTR